jgi:hypothetical protein
VIAASTPLHGPHQRPDSSLGERLAPRLGRRWRRVDQAADGLAVDLGLYLLSAGFAGFTATSSTLTSHRAWGSVAVWGYLAASVAVVVQLLLRRYGQTSARPGAGATAGRGAVTVLTWLAVAVLPLIVQAVQRAAGTAGRAQEEVLVVEQSARRLLDTGTPYLGRDGIAGLGSDVADRLLGYTPYQPAMALFGLPRAVFGVSWWTDARVWFPLVTAVALVLAVRLLRDGMPARDALLVRAVQSATVLPLCALTVATGGDDLPVLALCLLSLALAARSRFGSAGLAVGAAAAMKLFAWPVAVVLGVCALARRSGRRYALGAAGLPLAALLPALLVDPGAFMENVIRFPTGHGLVTSPAASPLLGRLIAQHVPGGRLIALALLVSAGLTIAGWLVRRPPRDAGAAALFCAAALLVAIVLMPATRFGYLLYPAALALWAPALRPSPSPDEPIRAPLTR